MGVGFLRRWPLPSFVVQNQGCFKGVPLSVEGRAQNVTEGLPPASPLSGNCTERPGNGASGIWLSTVLNIHTKDRFISHRSIWIKN